LDPVQDDNGRCGDNDGSHAGEQEGFHGRSPQEIATFVKVIQNDCLRTQQLKLPFERMRRTPLLKRL
jgi:hypothetical protein